jgi:hypothetical protein
LWNYAVASTPSSIQPSEASVVATGQHGMEVGSANVIGSNLWTFTNSSTPTQIGPTDVKETVFIRDDASGQSGSLTFNTTLTGMVSKDGAWLGVVPNGPTTQQLHLGHYFYTVTIDPFQAPADPSSFGGHVAFDIKVHHNPEPSSLILAGLGLSFAGFVHRRQRRKKAA